MANSNDAESGTTEQGAVACDWPDLGECECGSGTFVGEAIEGAIWFCAMCGKEREGQEASGVR